MEAGRSRTPATRVQREFTTGVIDEAPEKVAGLLLVDGEAGCVGPT